VSAPTNILENFGDIQGWSGLNSIAPANTNAFHQTPVDGGEATNADAEVKFYASLNNAGYTNEAGKPKHINGYMMENWTNWAGNNTNREILYEKLTTPYPNLTIYSPIQKVVNYSVPVYFILKGTDSLWEVLSDLDLFVDYTTTQGTEFLTHKLTGYFEEQQSITTFIKNYLDVINTTHQIVFTGHSLGCKFIVDIVSELVRDHNMSHRIQSVRCFNPYVFPGSTNYMYCYNQARAGTYNSLFREHWHFYIIKADFASVFVRSPNVGFGNVIYYDNVNTVHNNVNTDTVRTLSDWLSTLTLGLSRQSYLDVVNHKITNWNLDLPVIVYGGHVVDSLNQVMSLSTWLEKAMPNYFDGNTDLRQLFVWKDPSPPAGKENNMTANIRHEADASHEAEDVENFVIVQNYNADKTTYFKYQIGANWYVAFNITASWVNSSGQHVGTQIPIYIITVDTSNDIHRFLLGIPSTTANKEIDVLRINSGDWNDSGTFNHTLDKDNHGSELLIETYENFIATQLYANAMGASNTQVNKFDRSLWRVHSGEVAPIIDANGRRGAYAPTYTAFHTMLALVDSSITNINIYLISLGAEYSGSVDSTERIIFIDTTNVKYFAVPPNTSSSAWPNIEGLSAVSPDDEVWNFSYNPHNNEFVIQNTQQSSNGRLYEDTSTGTVGSGISHLYESVSLGTSQTDLTTSDFPFINTKLHIIHNYDIGGHRIYQLFIFINDVKHYLYVQQNSFSNGHSSSYGYLTLIKDSNVSSTNMKATQFKMNTNVSTAQGIP
jgi:hypothetical protein